ncbi:sodium:solute symporter family protein [Vibrio agarivorans]|uniref:sodium:solute symporter family protein n=1 Tax=Vibrio agarivorans TaxID=153622 RepID=UPI0025B617FC|nr:sodium:solute symporter family protein [Vibrio agarivorans]MDN3660691.1 sodium:solute symporter family protein [Vibrio agarivorans]
MNIDILVVGVYFVFMIAVGLIFKRFAGNSTSDYFRGGGKMLWWMVGATAFMTQFSAWTFTGAAGKAFTDGFPIMVIFIANAFGFLLSWLFFSYRFRQMRVVTPVEGVRRRFGATNEQVFTWATMPTSIVYTGIWLNGLALFVSAVFKIDIETTIVVTGLIVLFISVIGGSWGVVASDFVQMVVIMAVTVVCAVAAIVKIGGPSNLIEQFPADSIMGPDMNYPLLFVAWFIFMFVKQLQNINNMQDSYRFLTAKDSVNARKAALLAFALMLIGPAIWFMPPWVSAVIYPDALVAHSDALGGKAADAVYLVFVERAMPVGMVGLLMSAVFAATMSSMDSGLNRNAGVFVRNFYSPIINKTASEKKLMRVSQLVTSVFGVLIIIVALFINSLRELSLFDAMMYVSTLLQMPILVPLFFGMFIKKTPDWAAWATLLVGVFVSYLVSFVITPDVIANMLGLENGFTGREASDLIVMNGIIGHLVITGGFFCLTTKFYKAPQAERAEELNEFWTDVATPVIEEEGQDEFDRQQRSMLGRLILVFGALVMAMVLIPNPFWGRMAFVFCGGVVLTVGALLLKSAKVSPKLKLQTQS